MKSESKLKANATRTFLALIIFGGAIAALFYAYTQQQQREDLEARIWKEKSTINEQVLNLYQEIETNLAEITAHENVIRESVIQPKQEGYYTPQEKIQNEIKIIEALLAQNKDLIASLNSQIGAQDEQLAMYTKRVDNLTGKVSQYKKQLALFEKENEELKTNLADSEAHNLYLNNEVEAKTIKINEQTQQMDVQQQTLQTQADKLAANEILINTAYYVVGTYPDLRDAGIVEKSGSIIGLGGTKVLADDFDRNKFVKIDLRNYTIIPVNSKKAELVSDHRISSYEWVTDEKGIMWLKINDPETFWESSKYMVIVTKDSPNLGLAKND
jgi:hypothetical protein